MTQREKNKWDERHFQVCMALIGRAQTDTYGYTKPLDFDKVIRNADLFINLLQEREEKIFAKGEISEKIAK